MNAARTPIAAVTITDVAREAGVSTSTVSRALTRPDRVNAATRERVEAIARSLGYHPNPQARSLTSGRTHALALFIPGATNPYFFDLIRGTQEEAKARGYRHMLIDTEGDAETEATVLAELAGAVDGAVIAGSRQADAQLVAASRRMPVVVVNREIQGVQCVLVDTSTAVTRAFEYLVSLGHTRMAFLSGPKDSWSSERRREAVAAAAARFKVDCVYLGPFADMQSGPAAADAALHRGATAGLFFNDMLAIGALKRFAERGVVVPRDFSVVGCDDIFGADFCNPPLTTLTSPIDELARIATDMLLTRLHGMPVADKRTLPAHLTVRQSAGPVPKQ